MAQKTIPWQTGSGAITLTYNGEGDGSVVVTSDANDLAVARQQTVSIATTDGSNIVREVTVVQGAAPAATGASYSIGTAYPTAVSIAAGITSSTIPAGTIELDRSSKSRPGDEYLVYPKSWETQGYHADIRDWNNFTVGVSAWDDDEEDYEDMEVNGVVYVVRRVVLGKGVYTMSFVNS